MKKVVLALTLAFSLLLGFFAPLNQSVVLAEGVEAEVINPEDYPKYVEPELKTFRLDNKKVKNFSFYTIEKVGGSAPDYYVSPYSYVRLEDMAAALNGQPAQFNVTIEGNQVIITTGEGYKATKDDLIPRVPSKDFTISEMTYIINGQEVKMDALTVDGDEYVQLGSLRNGLGQIYYTSMDTEKATLKVFPRESDIDAISPEDLKEEITGRKFTVLFIWATWCPYSQAEMDHFYEFVKYAKKNGDKVVSLVYDYKAVDKSMLRKMIGHKESDNLVHYGLGSRELISYLENDILKGKHEVYFPTVIILDEEGNMVSEYENDKEFSWVEVVQQAWKDMGYDEDPGYSKKPTKLKNQKN